MRRSQQQNASFSVSRPPRRRTRDPGSAKRYIGRNVQAWSITRAEAAQALYAAIKDNPR